MTITETPQLNGQAGLADVGGSIAEPVRIQPRLTSELIWDLTSISAALYALSKETKVSAKVTYRSLAQWAVDRAAGDRTVAATAFVSLGKDPAKQQAFVNSLRIQGFGVFARPHDQSRPGMRDAIISHVTQRAATIGDLVLATNDRRLVTLCRKALPQSSTITVLGFTERCSGLGETEGIEFIDLEDVPGLFSQPLGRSVLARIGADGAFLPPAAPLGTPVGKQADDSAPAPEPDSEE